MQKLHSNQRMSQIVIHNQTIYLSGQVGNGEDDIKAQTLTCLEKVEKLLQEVGSDKSKLLSATVWLKSMSDFAAMNEVYKKYYQTECPARSAFAVKSLPMGALVEIETIAVR